jgi:hypothetical protein
MGSDPQSMLEWEDQNCKCYAGRERPGLLKRIEDLEAKIKNYEILEMVVIAFLKNNINYATFLARLSNWVNNKKRIQ